jgi:hypothetical protein
MGTWGVNSFDNDAARDWAAEAAPGGREALSAVIEAVFDADRLDADLVTRGIAAAEVVAALMGRPESAETARIAGTFGLAPDDALALKESAGHVVYRAVGEGTELRQLWEDAGPDEFDAWLHSLRSLLTRLAGADEAAPGPEKPATPRPSDSPDLSEAILLEVRGLRADIAVLRMDLADGLKQIRRDILGGRK